MFDRARSRALVAALGAVVLLSGCDLFFSGSDGGRDAGPPDAGPEGRWALGPVARVWEPGRWMTLEVEGVDVAPEEASLWVLEEGVDYPFFARRRMVPPRSDVEVPEDDLDAGTPEVDAGDGGVEATSYAFVTPLPILREGVFHIAVGTADGPLTRFAEIEVRVPEAPLSREEAGDAMVAGIVGMHADLDALLRTDDPDWQAFVAESGGTDAIAELGTLGEDFAAIGEVAREQYMAFPLETEPALRVFLWNSGMLEAFARRTSTGATFVPLGGGVLSSAVARSPLQATLFSLDVLSMAFGVLGLACDITAILGAAATAPSGGIGALIGLGPKIAIAALRVILDSFVPCDVGEIFEVQTSRRVFEGEGFMVVPWAIWRPQNTTAGGTVRSFEDLVLIGVEAAFPVPAATRGGLRNAIREAGRYIVMRLPGLGLDSFLSRVEWRTPTIALPLDLGFYNITVADVISLNPGLAPLALAVRALGDPEIVSPVELVAATTAGSPSTRFDYGNRSVSIHDVRWPGATAVETTRGILRVRAFGFATEGRTAGGAQIMQLPFPYTVDRAAPLVTIQSVPNPANPSETIADEDFILLDVAVGGSPQRWISLSTTTTRTSTIILNDQASGVSSDRPQLAVIVNGSPQYTGPGDVTVPVAFVPGLNEVQVVALSGHTVPGLRCSPDRGVCFSIRFPDADNPNTLAYLRGETGVSRTFRVWTPPTMPPDE